jgi:hypothetical protein
MFFKSHELPQPNYRNVIYIVRDGRDVIVSQYHYLKAIDSSVEFTKVAQGQYTHFEWHEHVEQWLSNPYQANIIIVKYEDLLADTAQELQRLCRFLALDLDQDQLQAIAARASFNKMQKKEIRYGMANLKWPKGKLFTRRGVAGSYHDEMPADVLEVFMNRASEALKHYGYI